MGEKPTIPTTIIVAMVPYSEDPMDDFRDEFGGGEGYLQGTNNGFKPGCKYKFTRMDGLTIYVARNSNGHERLDSYECLIGNKPSVHLQATIPWGYWQVCEVH